VLQLKEVEKPTPGDNEVLIKIQATTVNRTDCGFRKPEYPLIIRLLNGVFKPKRTILGSELAGEVEAVGKGVKLFKKGDQVFGLTGNKFGAQVTAVCNTKNLELVKSLGADEVIDYTKDDFTKNGQTHKVVFDAVGKTSFFRCKNLIKKGGVYLSTDLGFLAQNLFLVLWTRIFGSKKVIFPIPKDRKQDVAFFKELVEAGKYKAVIDRRYPLGQIVEAYRYVEAGQKTGNVVITMETLIR
jgi:NADPH:quinone reductase-like Zn-dependent oxidoreductase